MKKVKSFNELQLERIRLESLLLTQKQELRYQVAALKEQVNPLSMLDRWKRGLQNKLSDFPLATIGAKQGVDLVVRDMLLSKSNWMVRSVVPFILKKTISFLSTKNKSAEQKQLADGGPNGKNSLQVPS